MVVADTVVIHVEIRVYKTGFQVRSQVVFFRHGRLQLRRIALLQHLVELGDGNLCEVSLAGDECIPASCILGNELYFDAVGKRRYPALERFKPQPCLVFRIEAFSLVK